MKLTNRLNLVQALVKAVGNDTYHRGDADISVTSLLRPMRAVVLEEKHKDEITEDVADRLWSLYGQIVHQILERANNDENVVTERRLFMTVDGIKISGSMDSYEVTAGGTLRDFKFQTSYKFKTGVIDPEFEKQQNCYAQLLRNAGHSVKEIEIIGLLRDHSKMEARRDPAYPQLPVAVMKIPVWPEAKALAFLKGRIADYKAALVNLPECTPEERWARPDVYAVMKEGRKSAVRLHDNAETANDHVAQLGAAHSVVKRPGESIKCIAYCSAAQFCSQAKKLNGGSDE